MLGTSVKRILVGSVVTSTCFATTSLNDIFFVKNYLPKIQNIETKKSNMKGSDFSGNWSGSCKDIDGPALIEIQQSENSITINGQGFLFGAMTTIASSNTDSYNNSQMRFTWNSSKTVLTLNGTSINSGNNEKIIYTSISKSSMALDHEQLIMKIQAKFYTNLDSMGDTFDRICIFSKLQ